MEDIIKEHTERGELITLFNEIAKKGDGSSRNYSEISSQFNLTILLDIRDLLQEINKKLEKFNK